MKFFSILTITIMIFFSNSSHSASKACSYSILIPSGVPLLSPAPARGWSVEQQNLQKFNLQRLTVEGLREQGYHAVPNANDADLVLYIAAYAKGGVVMGGESFGPCPGMGLNTEGYCGWNWSEFRSVRGVVRLIDKNTNDNVTMEERDYCTFQNLEKCLENALYKAAKKAPKCLYL